MSARKEKSGELLDNATRDNVKGQVARLKSSPPIIQKQYAEKKIDYRRRRVRHRHGEGDAGVALADGVPLNRRNRMGDARLSMSAVQATAQRARA
jgi:hypothetical protein